MDSELMKELIDNKDKIKASTAKRDSFMKEWLSYVSENGYDDTAADYLYKGFEYKKMLPFVEFAIKNNNFKDMVVTFLKGKTLQTNRAKTYKMLLNLLAETLVMAPQEKEAMAIIIKRLPSLSCGKDKNPYPDLGKMFEKFFLSEITPESSLTKISEIGLTPAMESSFKKLVSDSLAGITAKNTASINAIEKVKAWVGRPLESPNEAVTTQTDAPQEENKSSNDNTDIKERDVASVPQEVTWKDSIRFIESTLINNEKRILSLSENLSSNLAEKSQLHAQIELLRKNIEDKQSNIEQLQSVISEQQHNIKMHEKQIEELKQTITEKNIEIADRIKLTDIVSKDSAKRSDATLKRITSELSSYLEDFRNAENVPMTVEIGEILRDQLKDVYKILANYGIGTDK